jgi:hypothetical protein
MAVPQIAYTNSIQPYPDLCASPDVAERCKPFTEGFASIFGDIDEKLFGRRFHIGKCSLWATIRQGGRMLWAKYRWTAKRR